MAIMAPTAAMALNGTVAADLIGRAVPLAFLFATIGVLFVSYGFVRLTRHFNQAGSVFALAGATLGPRAGFFAGWALMATYTRSPSPRRRRSGCSGSRSSTGIGAGRRRLADHRAGREASSSRSSPSATSAWRRARCSGIEGISVR